MQHSDNEFKAMLGKHIQGIFKKLLVIIKLIL